MPGDRRTYKSYELYCCFALNRLASELDLNLGQQDLEQRLEGILAGQRGLSKSDIQYEIKSNNFMTNKVLEKLSKEGLVDVDRTAAGYQIRITKAGILHVQSFNAFYWQMFNEHIKEHYRYGKMPIWFERLG
jgi:predicted transcriptional regulator